MALTELAIRNAKAKEKAFKLADAGGLFLFVSASGGRLWRFKYRVAGKEKLLSIGPYPLISLKAARDARDDAKRDLIKGVDPSRRKNDARLQAKAEAEHTFRHIAEEYVAKLQREGRADGTMDKIRWYLSFAYPAFGDRELRTISAANVLDVLRSIEMRGRHETARKCRSTIGSIFRYAIATARAEADPTLALKGALTRPVVTPRAAITDLKAFASLLKATWGYDGSPEVVAALKLLILLFPRPGELRQARWSEFDLDEQVWTIPASRMKARRTHRGHLMTQSVQILSELRAYKNPSAFVFPSVRSIDRCMSENTLNAALRRMGFTSKEVTAHGFRASFSTMANESGLWHPDAIERALAHIETSKVRRAYARGEHWDERVRMAEWWANKCETLRG